MIDRKVQWIESNDSIEAESFLIFSACDAVYVGYAISLIRSVDIFSPGFGFVLHLINPEPESFERLKHLANSLKSTRLFISFETVELSSLSDEQKRAYYASARFPRLATLLEDHRLPMFSIDADSLVVNPIDLNFSDKPAAEVVLVRRDRLEDTPEHLSIATGSIWFLPNANVIEFVKNVASEIDAGLAAKTLEWFVDQIVFFRAMKENLHNVHFFNLKPKFADWEFKEKSIVWAGKGGRKLYDMRFFIIQAILSDDESRRELANSLVSNIVEGGSDTLTSKWMQSRLTASRHRVARISLYLPRLDKPWKRPKLTTANPPLVSEDTISLRLKWKEFTLRLANAIERAGLAVDILEVPAWEINRKQIEKRNCALALIPHRCHIDFEDGETPVMFYMQEYFRWVFVADKQGWSASSSVYPIDHEVLPVRTPGAFDLYRNKLNCNELGSKFAQAARYSEKELIRRDLVPHVSGFFGVKYLRPYIFFPLQIPDDQSIRYFSAVSELDVVEAVIAWARAHQIAVVLKPHPANLKSMLPFEKMADGEHVFISNAHVYDLIKCARAVYTINSGVGFEALLHVKPVVTFGRVEYDCVTFNASLDNLDAAWKYALEADVEEMEPRYSKFVDWFLSDYAVDMSRPDVANARMEELAGKIVAMSLK